MLSLLPALAVAEDSEVMGAVWLGADDHGVSHGVSPEPVTIAVQLLAGVGEDLLDVERACLADLGHGNLLFGLSYRNTIP